VIFYKYCCNILQFFSHIDCQDDLCQNYEKLSKFLEVTAKILSVPFFLDVYYDRPQKQKRTSFCVFVNYN